MKKIAFFDFDGTLSRGYICIDFLDYLFKWGICPSHLYQEQRKIIKKYQEGKREFMEHLIKSGKYDMTDSVAFGDSPHDAAMLEKVRFPIALNPSKEMFSLARKNKWAILNYNNVVKHVRNLLK